jgi:hypothetical protein
MERLEVFRQIPRGTTDSRTSSANDNREENADKAMSAEVGSNNERVNVTLPPSVSSASPSRPGSEVGDMDANVLAPMPPAYTPDHSVSVLVVDMTKKKNLYIYHGPLHRGKWR